MDTWNYWDGWFFGDLHRENMGKWRWSHMLTNGRNRAIFRGTVRHPFTERWYGNEFKSVSPGENLDVDEINQCFPAFSLTIVPDLDIFPESGGISYRSVSHASASSNWSPIRLSPKMDRSEKSGWGLVKWSSGQLISTYNLLSELSTIIKVD